MHCFAFIYYCGSWNSIIPSRKLSLLVDDQLVANASCTYMEDNELDCPLFEQDVMCIDWNNNNNIICIVVLHMQVYSGTI